MKICTRYPETALGPAWGHKVTMDYKGTICSSLPGTALILSCCSSIITSHASFTLKSAPLWMMPFYVTILLRVI